MSFLHLSYSNHLAISFHNNLYSITLLHLTHTENTRSLTHCTLLPILYQHLCTVLVELASKKQLNVTIMHENRCAPPIIGWINKPYILAVRIGTVLQESSRTENDKKMCLPRIFHPVGCLYPQESATISLQNALKVPYTVCVFKLWFLQLRKDASDINSVLNSHTQAFGAIGIRGYQNREERWKKGRKTRLSTYKVC